jgi:hypothetical protein
MAVGATNTEFAGDDVFWQAIGHRFRWQKIYFGTVVERIKGAFLAAADLNGIRLWKAVKKMKMVM